MDQAKLLRVADFTGAQALEGSAGKFWRWASGSRSSVAFPLVAPAGGRVLFRLMLPEAGTKVAVQFRRQEKKVCSASPREQFNFSFELPPSPEEQSLEFKFEASAAEMPFAFFGLSFFPHRKFTEAEAARIRKAARTGTAPKNFCPIPFTQLYVSSAGRISACCESMGPAEELAGDEGLMLESAGDLALAWNRPEQRQLRKEMLLGERPAVCQLCYARDDSGVLSQRSYYSGLVPEAMAVARQMQEDGGLAAPPGQLDLRLGNNCNLKCRMCAPIHSRKLVEEFNLIHGQSFDRFRDSSWMRPDILQGITRFTREAKQITVAGGEPFLTPEFKALLERYISEGAAPGLAVKVITNATHLPEDTLQLFRGFREAELLVSLDGYGPVNDFVRFPSKFAQIQKNLQFLHEQMEEFNIRRVEFHSAISVDNLFGLPKLLQYLSQFSRFHWLPSLNPVQAPDYLSIQILPAEAKEAAKRELEEFLKTPELQFTEKVAREKLEAEVRGLLHFLLAADRSALIPEYRRVAAIMNGKRSQMPPRHITGLHE